MKKIYFVLLIFALLIIGYVYINKLYYPSMPIESVQKKELVAKGEEALNKLVYVTSEKGYDWYIICLDSPQSTGELIQQAANEHNWQFIEQLGSGYMFARNDEQLIITAKMWSHNYQLIQVPANTFN